MSFVRDTSVVTYYELVDSGYVSDRCQLVYDFLKDNPCFTDSELCVGLGFVDPNCVRPRRKELFDIGLVESVGKRVCGVTGRVVYVWRVKPFVDSKKFYDKKEVKVSGFVTREFRSVNLTQFVLLVHLYLFKYQGKKFDCKFDSSFDRGVYVGVVTRRDC